MVGAVLLSGFPGSPWQHEHLAIGGSKAGDLAEKAGERKGFYRPHLNSKAQPSRLGNTPWQEDLAGPLSGFSLWDEGLSKRLELSTCLTSQTHTHLIIKGVGGSGEGGQGLTRGLSTITSGLRCFLQEILGIAFHPLAHQV